MRVGLGLVDDGFGDEVPATVSAESEAVPMEIDMLGMFATSSERLRCVLTRIMMRVGYSPYRSSG